MARVAPNVCLACDTRLNEAANAMRHHWSEMNAAIYEVQSGRLTEEEWQELKPSLWASFNEAQSAWDAYREHLIEHGILPERS